MKHPAWICLALTASVTACSGGDDGSSANEPATPAQVEATDPLPPDHPAVGGLDIRSRGPRRMSVDQLERSIEAFADLPPGSVVIPEDLAVTLGKPDYLQTTEENLDPTPLFMKFMMDLGGLICPGLATADAARPASERLFTRFDRMQDNLRHVLMMTTGITGDDAEPYLPRLQRVFEAGRQGPQGDVSGHEALCLALLTSPEFLLY